MEKTQIMIMPGEFVLTSPMYDYLQLFERKEICDDVDNRKSVIFSVIENENNVASAVLDVLKESIHLRHVCGYFIKYSYALECMIVALGKAEKKEMITLSDTRLKRFMTKKMKFFFDNERNEYIRKI